ncbi:protein NrfI [Opitutia bacterium]|nr:protein NrfI [Opitutae bacterium]
MIRAKSQMSDGIDLKATQGIGARTELAYKPLPESYDDNKPNAPTAIVELKTKEKSLGIWALNLNLTESSMPRPLRTPARPTSSRSAGPATTTSLSRCSWIVHPREVSGNRDSQALRQRHHAQGRCELLPLQHLDEPTAPPCRPDLLPVEFREYEGRQEPQRTSGRAQSWLAHPLHLRRANVPRPHLALRRFPAAFPPRSCRQGRRCADPRFPDHHGRCGRRRLEQP